MVFRGNRKQLTTYVSAELWEKLTTLAHGNRSKLVEDLLERYFAGEQILDDVQVANHPDTVDARLTLLESALSGDQANALLKIVKFKTKDRLQGQLYLQNPIFPAGVNPQTGMTTFEVRDVPAAVPLNVVAELFASVPAVERRNFIFTYPQLVDWHNRNCASQKICNDDDSDSNEFDLSLRAMG